MRPLLLAALVACVVACSEENDVAVPADRPVPCKQISLRCHEVAALSAKATECHESAHETWTEAECTAQKAECFAACPVGDAGADSGARDTGSVDGSSDGGSSDSTADDSASDARAD